MEQLPQQRHTKEFCQQAVRLGREQEPTIPEAARGMSMSDQTLAGMEGTHSPVMELDAEVSRLKRELADAHMECAILKQTVAYFAKVQLPGTRS